MYAQGFCESIIGMDCHRLHDSYTSLNDSYYESSWWESQGCEILDAPPAEVFEPNLVRLLSQTTLSLK